MDKGKTIGLYLFVGGIVLLLIYGLYQFVKEIGGMNVIIAIGVGAIILGIIILLISLIFEQTSDMKKRKEKIKKEDLEP